MDLSFSPEEKYFASCLILIWITLHSHTLFSSYLRWTMRAEARKDRLHGGSFRTRANTNWAYA
jgi:hypothetical protein